MPHILRISEFFAVLTLSLHLSFISDIINPHTVEHIYTCESMLCLNLRISEFRIRANNTKNGILLFKQVTKSSGCLGISVKKRRRNQHTISVVTSFLSCCCPHQEQYEKVMGHMQERMEEVEAKLKNVRMMLQEKVNQLKEQVGARYSALLIPKTFRKNLRFQSLSEDVHCTFSFPLAKIMTAIFNLISSLS